MYPSHWRRALVRASRLESCEPRIMMSAAAADESTLGPVLEAPLLSAAPAAFLDAGDLVGLAQARGAYGFDGAGQTVAILDSGIAYDHTALGAGFGAGHRVVGGWDFTGENDADPYDDGPLGAHGTHVAGIVAANDGTHLGVAPGADLVALRVFDDNGRSDFAWIEKALAWVHANRNTFAHPITTVNLSIGAAWNSDVLPSWATLEDELAQLKADGIFIAVAAGNGFSSGGTPGLSYPAASSSVVPVSSVDEDGSLSYFSQRNSRVIAAPGRRILSTVPDYLGDLNGVADDFVKLSGTSMAAPYVAGASVLLREAYGFLADVGMDSLHAAGVNQDALYALMRDTADRVFDPATNQSYARLNLDRALDAIMPKDDFGSTPSAAFNLGALSGTTSIAGLIGRLDDRDYFTFTAGRTGTVTLTADTSGALSPVWEVPGVASHVAGARGNLLSFEVVAGQAYTVGLSSRGGLGRYGIEVALAGAESNVDWGTVLFNQYSGVQLGSASGSFAFTAGRDGLLTIEMSTSGMGEAAMQLYDRAGRLLGSSTNAGTLRIDVTAAAGERFVLRVSGNGKADFSVTNLVSVSGDEVRVHGTAGDDAFQFVAGPTHRVTINGVEYAFDASRIAKVEFDGGAGADLARVTGGQGNDTAVLRAGSVELAGASYRVVATGVETIYAQGGGGLDTASLYDTAGDDSFKASPGQGRLYGNGFSNWALGFERLTAYATAGGNDRGYLSGFAARNMTRSATGYTAVSGSGWQTRTEGFQRVYSTTTASRMTVAVFPGPAHQDSAALTTASSPNIATVRASSPRVASARVLRTTPRAAERLYSAAAEIAAVDHVLETAAV
ncbi:MAG: S8 family serine peptidase [Pirellulales bacterium]